ncbi:MAG: hypothetical protein ACRC14_00020, partial [Paracoccaceae bacterium]
GAVLFGADPLAEIAAAALPDTFVPSRFRVDPMDPATLLEQSLVNEQTTLEEIAERTGSAPAWRVTRVQPFDDGLPP